MKYLGIDYGSKKIGVAISDEMSMLAFPLQIILNKDKEKSLQEILNIVTQNKIKNIVIGESVNQKGELNKIALSAREFAFNLEEIFLDKNIDCGVHFEKEWYSTLEARRYDDRRDADDSAAAIILQRFLDKINKNNNLH
jgi:putative Holliday junction resolvase